MTGNDVTYTYSTSGRTEDGAAQSERRANLFVFPSQSNVGVANPMYAAVDCSHYAYDYAGERTIKLTGRNSFLDVNADLMRTASVLSEITIYPSPYVVLSNKGYTKHYYAGGDRVCARTGGGGLPMAPRDAPMSSRADDLFAGCLNQCHGRRLDSDNPACIHGIGWDDEVFRTPIVGSPKMLKVSPAFETTPFVGKMAYYATHDDPETDVYYYHSDHLGSASWITDNGGQAIQHLQYLPYGEPYINQRTSGYSERFTFTGKERDEEKEGSRGPFASERGDEPRSGIPNGSTYSYTYFGARYMDHELTTLWLSVDPLADKYPSISPYAYCMWNPMKLVDPFGEMPRLPLWLRAATSRHVYEAILYKIKHGGDLSVWETHRGCVFASVSSNSTENNNVTISEKMFRPRGYTDQEVCYSTNDPFVRIESWLDETTGTFMGDFGKSLLSIAYGTINGGFQYITGFSMAGTEANPMEKTSAFFDIASVGMNKTIKPIGLIRTTATKGANFSEYEDFISKTGGRKGRRSEDIGREYRLNKENMHTIKDAYSFITNTKKIREVINDD